MKLFFVIVAIHAVTAVPCYARLGETFAQCEARYGKVVIKFPGMVNGELGDYRACFKKDGFCITAVIYNGVVGEEIMWKQDFSDIDQTELTALMDADSANFTWTERNVSDPNKRMFDRNDGAFGAFALYKTDTHHLFFWSKEYLSAGAAKQKAERDAKLPGF